MNFTQFGFISCFEKEIVFLGSRAESLNTVANSDIADTDGVEVLIEFEIKIYCRGCNCCFLVNLLPNMFICNSIRAFTPSESATSEFLIELWDSRTVSGMDYNLG